MIESSGFSWFSSDDTGMHEEGTNGEDGRDKQSWTAAERRNPSLE